MAEKSTFAVLNAINCNEHTEKKNGLTYLSWAWAWQIAKTNYPDAQYTIYENADGLNYHHDGRTCWVKTGVTIGGIEHIEYLPVMDHRNASIPRDKVTSFDVNKAIQRSLTKALARHGLGLYIYAGEDLPDAEDDQRREMTNSQIRRNVDAALLPGGERFAKAVEAHAKGETAGGRTYREIWARTVKADAGLLAAFDEAVANYKIEHNLL